VVCGCGCLRWPDMVFGHGQGYGTWDMDMVSGVYYDLGICYSTFNVSLETGTSPFAWTRKVLVLSLN
jgi:hypothetical protein